MQQKTSDFRKNFSEGLKYARIRRNLTQSALANELKEGETTITNWEQGTNGPHRSKLAKIGDFFGVEIDPFTGRWESPKPPAASALGEMSSHRTWDRPSPEMSLEEFRDAVDRFAVECHRRGHRLAARTLMDLVDELDGLPAAQPIALGIFGASGAGKSFNVTPSSSPVGDVAKASMEDAERAASQPPESRPKPGAGAPSVHKHKPGGGAGRGA